MNKNICPEEFIEKKAPAAAEVITAINRGNDDDLELIQQGINWRP